MGYKAIYAYPWDLAETGVSAAVDRFLALGLDTVTIAGSYHAGKFLRPHGKGGKVYFPEDGTIYFKPDLSRYGAIKPVANSMLSSGQDIVRELVGPHGDQCLARAPAQHAARLAHPDASSPTPSAIATSKLCPSAPEARAYAVGLARDVTESYPVSGVSLETPGFLPYAHGYHHEFALNRPNRWLDSQLGLCFCRALQGGRQERRYSRRGAEAAGGSGHRSLSRERRRFPRRHGGSLLARGRPQRRRSQGSFSTGDAQW